MSEACLSEFEKIFLLHGVQVYILISNLAIWFSIKFTEVSSYCLLNFLKKKRWICLNLLYFILLFNLSSWTLRAATVKVSS